MAEWRDKTVPVTAIYAACRVAAVRYGVDQDDLIGLSRGPPVMAAARNQAAAVLYEITNAGYSQIGKALGISGDTAATGIRQANESAGQAVANDAALAKRYIEVNSV